VYRKPVAHLLTEMSAGHAQWMTTEERERDGVVSVCAAAAADTGAVNRTHHAAVSSSSAAAADLFSLERRRLKKSPLR